MKVLHLLASPFFTGPAEAVTQLALAQRALGHDVSVLVDTKRRVNTSEELAVPRLQELGLLAPSPALELSVKSTPLGMLRDVLALRSVDVEVVHCHFSHDHSLARLARPRGSVLVRSIHAPRSLRWATPKADAYTVPTAALARRLLGPPVMLLPALVGPEFNPAVDRTQLRRALSLPTEGPLVGMVSTFQPSRRHAVGLAAFSLLLQRVPNARMALIGDGALEAALKHQAATARIDDRIHFMGYRAGRDFIGCLQALDEVWVLGLGNDFAGRAAAQARACGVRVVAVDEGALEQYADALVEPLPSAVAAASLSVAAAPRRLETPTEIATRVLELYRVAQAQGAPSVS